MKEEITILQEKNRHRKALLKHYKQIHEKDLKEIERLNNIIKEARELLNQEWYSVLRKETITKAREILDKEKV